MAFLGFGGGVGGTAAGAEFLVGRELGLATGALQNGPAVKEIEVLSVVLRARFGVDLLLGGLGLLGAQLLLLVGGAVFAEADAVVPAGIGAHPMAAAGALLKLLLALGHGRF